MHINTHDIRHPSHDPEWYKRSLHEQATVSHAYPSDRFAGKGIVIVAGGLTYLSGAWASVNILRSFGVSLPIELWYFGDEECDDSARCMFEGLGVRCIDAKEHFAERAADLERERSTSKFGLFETKCYAILQSHFEEVLFLDADNMPLRSVEGLFEDLGYREHGVLFWPDPPYGAHPPDASTWEVCGLPMQPGPAFESGQILIHKRKCWNALQLCWWMNEHSDYWFSVSYGDKDTYKIAWHVLGAHYAVAPMPFSTLAGVVQHGPDGMPSFYHRWFYKPGYVTRRIDKVGDGKAAEEFARAMSMFRLSWNGRFWFDGEREGAPPQGLYRLSVDGDIHEAYVRADGKIDSLAPGVESWHMASMYGQRYLVIQGRERVTYFLRPSGSGWSGVNGVACHVELWRSGSGWLVGMRLRCAKAIVRARRVLRIAVKTCIRIVELGGIVVFGAEGAGMIRRFSREIARATRR